MAETKKKDTAATAGSEETTQAAKEQEYTVGSLRSHCLKLFGCTTSTFDGAMYGNSKDSLTVKEAKGIIDTWLHGKGGKK